MSKKLLVLSIFLLAVTARLLPGPRTIDDSYITFRYARNILAGNGFVYNPGERVLGTTTPLYTILLTGLAYLTGRQEAPFPWIAVCVNALADAFTCLLLLQIGRRLNSEFVGIAAALVWTITPFSVTFAIGGLETSLYIFLLTLMVLMHISRRRVLAALTAALALLTRPDALILIGLLVLDRLYQAWSQWQADRRNDVRPGLQKDITGNELSIGEFAAFFVPVIFWSLFAFSYFGSPLPHSIMAKTLAYRLPGNSAFIRLLQHYATPFLGHLTFGIPWIGVGIVIYPFLFLVGALKATRANPRVLCWVAYPWLYFAVFALANPLIFRWYLTPPLPAYIFVILLGVKELIDKLRDQFHVTKPPATESILRTRFSAFSALIFVVAVPFLLTLRGWDLHPNHGLTEPAPDMAWYELELLYQQAAQEISGEINSPLNNNSPVLAAGDVGVLGYFTQARILDTVGLNSAQSLNYYPLDPSYYTINYAIPPDLIIDTQPQFVIILEVYGREGLLKDARFLQCYQLEEKIPTDIYGSEGMLVFRRKPGS
jgi:hypothetical protein